MRVRVHNAAVVDAAPTLSSEAETRAGSEAHRDGVAPLKQAPEEAPASELPDEHRDVLQMLHTIPGWRVHAERERQLLDELCALTDGKDDAYEPAFVLRRAREFARWWQNSEKEGTPDTRFGGFMLSTQPEKYARWQAEQSRARASVRAAQRAYDPVAREKEQRRQEEEINELIRLGVIRIGVREPGPPAAPGINWREEWNRRREESGHHDMPSHRTATAKPSAATGEETGAPS